MIDSDSEDFDAFIPVSSVCAYAPDSIKTIFILLLCDRTKSKKACMTISNVKIIMMITIELALLEICLRLVYMLCLLSH